MFVTNREASKQLGIHPNTLRKMANEGRIKFYRTESNQRRYDVEDYLRFKQKETTKCMFVTNREASKQLGIHPNTLRKMLDR